MGIQLRRTQSLSRRANSTNNHQSNLNSTSSNNSRSINNNNINNTASSSSSSSSSGSGSGSGSSTRKISRTRKTRSRSTSPPRNNYYLDNPYRQRQPVVMMVPNSLLPVTAYFPRDYVYEFEDEGYDSASSSTSESSAPAALGWRPTQGTLEMEFMFGDMDEEFMQELTRESTPSSDDDEVMMEADTYASGSSEETTASMYDHPATESEASEDEGGHDRQDRMGGRVVDEDYD